MLETIERELSNQHHEVAVRDLYALNFDPVLKASDFEAFKQNNVPTDIRVEQDFIRWANVLVFIYPLWWTGLPALLKGYIDRVFSNGFAFGVNAQGPYGLLGEKKVVLLGTTGTSTEVYEKSGMLRSLSQTIGEGIFKFCAMPVLFEKYYASVPTTSHETRDQMLNELKLLIREIFSQKD